ncbi:MAG: glycoside hydrolase family 31 protein [Myxococcota bacterium]
MSRLALDTRHFSGLGAVRRIERGPNGLLLELDEERFRVDVVRPDILRLKVSHGGRFDEKPTYAACFEATQHVAFDVHETDHVVELSTTALRIVIDKHGFSFDVFRRDGSPVIESVRDGNGRPRGFSRLNDSFTLRRKLTRFDSIYGLGERTGSFDRRRGSYTLWNVDVLADDVLRQNRLYEKDLSEPGRSTHFDPYYTTIPFFYHARGTHGLPMAGFFIDNGYKGNVEFQRDEFHVLFHGGQYTEYVFAGPKMRAVLEGYTFITGRMPLPPLWSLGHHQCRWHDYSDAELLELGLRYRERQIPCDVLWLDIGYMDGYRVFTWHPQRFPEPARLLEQLRAEGFRAVTIVDPGVKYEAGYAIFDHMRAQNLLCKTPGGALYVGQVWPGRTAFPDFVKPETRAFWGTLNASLCETGVAGIWNDMNEPATGEVEPFAMSFDRDGENHPHERYHNQYGLLMALATFDGLTRARPDERPFILSRAGFAGIQRVAAQWLGDNYSEWSHLQMGVPMALGMGVSGQPFIGADIPGFAENASNELAARWFEYGALTPFCRCHNCSGNEDHYPWSFGSGVERVAREALQLRYRLLPYLYGAFLMASETGAPVQRPLVFEFQDDLESRRVEDQYLLGDALLVAPVLRAGETARHVYLPPGCWIDFHDDTRHRGGEYAVIPAPLGRIPLLVRAGHVIPLLERAPRSTLGFQPELIELHVFVPELDGSTTSLLYEDDGHSTAHRRGAFLRTELTLTRRGRRIELKANVHGAGFPEFKRRRLRVVFHGNVDATAQLDGRELTLNRRTLVFDNAGQAFELDVALI